MEKLDSRHEKVFEAKVMFLQDDEKWDEAHEVLKDCVSAIPESVYCNRRLANIRSGTTEDKLFYGMRCLQIKANDLLCLVDVAVTLYLKGDFTRAKDTFAQACQLKMKSACEKLKLY